MTHPDSLTGADVPDSPVAQWNAERMTSRTDFGQRLQASWRVAFTALVLAVANLVISLTGLADRSTRSEPLAIVLICTTAGFLACMGVLWWRLRGRR